MKKIIILLMISTVCVTSILPVNAIENIDFSFGVDFPEYFGNLEGIEIGEITDVEIKTEKEDEEKICFACGEELTADEEFYDENEVVFCESCMNNIQQGDETDIEVECHNCGEICSLPDFLSDDNLKIYCYYCDEIISGEDADEIACYWCDGSYDISYITYDTNDRAVCCYCEEYNIELELFNDSITFSDIDLFEVDPFKDIELDEDVGADEDIDQDENVNQDGGKNFDDVIFDACDWAYIEVAKAYKTELIPEEMIYDNLCDNISREEFAAVAVKLYENAVGEIPYAEIEDTPFTDCSYESEYSPYIAVAYALGITTGTSETTFSPQDNISREQLATMLFRVIKLAENEGTYSFNENIDINNVSKFYDDSEISDYAKECVYFMAENGIIKGVDEEHFAPLSTATKEQAIIISFRIFNVLLNN